MFVWGKTAMGTSITLRSLLRHEETYGLQRWWQACVSTKKSCLKASHCTLSAVWSAVSVSGTNRPPQLFNQLTWWTDIQMTVNLVFQPQLLWVASARAPTDTPDIFLMIIHQGYFDLCDVIRPSDFMQEKNNWVKFKCLLVIFYSVLFWGGNFIL